MTFNPAKPANFQVTRKMSMIKIFLYLEYPGVFTYLCPRRLTAEVQTSVQAGNGRTGVNDTDQQ